MGLSNRYKKRVLIFLIIPVLVSIPFFTDNLILRIIVAVLGVVYVGFIIFLRDSKHEAFKKEFDYGSETMDEGEDEFSSFEKDEHDSSFEIVSNNKNIEVITADTFSDIPAIRRQNNFKPPDLKSNFDKLAQEIIPEEVDHDEQFGYLLERILNIIKDAYFVNSVIFFWYNKANNKLTLEKYVSLSDEVDEKKYDIEDDVISKIVRNEEPELLNDINPNAEKDIIRYYKNPQGIQSFIGVPLYYNKALTAILTLDSKEQDAFGIETIYSLARVVSVVSELISIFEDKFAEALAQVKLNALLGILSGEKRFETKAELIGTVERAVEGLLHWDAFSFVYFDPEKQLFSTVKVINNTKLKYIGENLEVELNGSLTGKAIVSGLPVIIDDISAAEYIRFSKSEDITIEGSYLAIPLVYEDQIYGVVCFESLKKKAYTSSDVNFIKSSMKFISFTLYSFSSQALLRSLLAHDVDTHALNYPSFMERMSADLIKAGELNAPGSLALIRIDDFLEEDSLFEENAFPKVLKAVAVMIQKEMTPLTTFGRLNDKTFGVYFFNSSTKDVFLWAEKLRIQIARKPIAIVSKQTTFTISVGICSSTGKTDVELIISDAELALGKAIEKGGNTVKSLN